MHDLNIKCFIIYPVSGIMDHASCMLCPVLTTADIFIISMETKIKGGMRG